MEHKEEEMVPLLFGRRLGWERYGGCETDRREEGQTAPMRCKESRTGTYVKHAWRNTVPRAMAAASMPVAATVVVVAVKAPVPRPQALDDGRADHFEALLVQMEGHLQQMEEMQA